MAHNPFSPGSTIILNATASSSSGSITSNQDQIRVYNAGPNTVFFRSGVGAQTAVVTDTPIPSGVVEVFSKGVADTIAAICSATQTATVYVTSGGGV